jgi:hypothetical protein
MNKEKKWPKSEMTDWECGQELIAIQDTMFDRIQGLEKTHPEIYKAIYNKACEIGDIFNALGSHEFGLRGTK